MPGRIRYLNGRILRCTDWMRLQRANGSDYSDTPNDYPLWHVGNFYIYDNCVGLKLAKTLAPHWAGCMIGPKGSKRFFSNHSDAIDEPFWIPKETFCKPFLKYQLFLSNKNILIIWITFICNKEPFVQWKGMWKILHGGTTDANKEHLFKRVAQET